MGTKIGLTFASAGFAGMLLFGMVQHDGMFVYSVGLVASGLLLAALAEIWGWK